MAYPEKLKVVEYSGGIINDNCVLCGEDARFVICDEEGDEIDMGASVSCDYFCPLTLCKECLKKLHETLKEFLEEKN